MKTCYIAARFHKGYDENGKLHLHNDFRAKLLGHDKLMNYNEESYINFKGEKLKYIGPFYCEQASNGDLTSTDCQTIVETEMNAVEKADVFIGFFDEAISPGSIAELMHAAHMNKEIHIFYTEVKTEYNIKSEYWFPMLAAKHVSRDKTKISLKKVNKLSDIFEKFKE